MWNVDPAFLVALAQHHGLVAVAKSYFNGVETGELSLNPGSSVRVTGRSQVRRTARLILDESQWRSGQLGVTGAEVRLWLTITAGTITYPLVPVFTGRVERRDRLRRAGLINVECWDRFAAVNDDAFEEPRPAPAGQPIVSEIIAMLTETFPTASVISTVSPSDLIPPAVTWDAGDGSRGRAIDKMARAIGAEVLALPDGNFLIRPVPLLTNAPVWTVATGAGGVVVSDAEQESRSGVANRWIVTGSATATGEAVRTTSTMSAGPLAYGGPYGRVVRTYSDAIITSNAQAQIAGDAILARVQGIGRQRTVEVITNPALEAGDVLAVSTEDGVEAHLADDFEVPLTVDQPTMRIASRSELT